MGVSVGMCICGRACACMYVSGYVYWSDIFVHMQNDADFFSLLSCHFVCSGPMGNWASMRSRWNVH